jgi:uncharacterized protein YcbX
VGVQLTALTIYPIKACKGISLEAARVTRRGLEHDRRFVIVDTAGRFVTQREHARLALVSTAIEGDALRVSAEGHGQFVVPLDAVEGARSAATVWSSTLEVPRAGAESAAFFSEFLGFSCELAYMPDDVLRPVSEKYGLPDHIVSFADAFPFLLATEASLADLNARLDEPLPMNRFRPNLVVDGVEPWAEERWPELRIGDIGFRNPKGCDRCVVTTVDQTTAAKGAEPLRTLAKFRMRENKVYFGVNLVPLSVGELRVGDAVSA